jgi:membrane protein YqaA with SNARE-associated domain
VLTVLTCLGLTLGVALGSAIVPLISIEIFVVGLVAEQPQIPWWSLGAVVAIGQVAGKLLYFLAARGSLHLPSFLHRRARRGADGAEAPPRFVRWTAARQRWRTWMRTVRVRCHRHPRWMVGTHAVSSVVGLPPFMATSVLAGLAGMSLAVFVTSSLLGRFLRYSVLAASPALLAHSWF